ncbi:hypothetical protein GGR53DRAFT_475110 [Hypoxylon sp. FL1150]|nr:hypothetical protein GGR53DRAFT_475110 [Hypoxylon sp. FL1150]
MTDEMDTSTLATEDHQAEMMDMRPDVSPYAGKKIILKFEGGPKFEVPTILVKKYPLLYSYLKGVAFVVDDWSPEMVHVLVHYLFTGEYQHLRLHGCSPADKNEAEFGTSLAVYTITKILEMPFLEELAKNEIKRLGRGLSVLQLLEVAAKNVSDFVSDDTWIRDYIKSLVEPLVENPLRDDHPDPKTVTIAGVLLKAMIELWHEKKDAVQLDPIEYLQRTAGTPSQTQEEQIEMNNDGGGDGSSAFTIIQSGIDAPSSSDLMAT